MKSKFMWALVLVVSVSLLTGAVKKDKKQDTDKSGSKLSGLFKKKDKKKVAPTVASVVLPTCGYSKIIVSPDTVSSPDLLVGSGKQIQFSAKAVDASGKEVPANLIWFFHGLPMEKKITTSGGHKLVASGSTATLSLDGLAAGNFQIAAQGSDCQDKDGREVRGLSNVVVNPTPGEPLLCGPVTIIYGTKEITNERSLGFTNLIFKSEFYGPKNVDMKSYKVNFYLNNKKVSPSAKLTHDNVNPAKLGQQQKYDGVIYYWLARGDFELSYELVKNNKPVCSSTATYFTTR
jgi:hypothetical protein